MVLCARLLWSSQLRSCVLAHIPTIHQQFVLPPGLLRWPTTSTYLCKCAQVAIVLAFVGILVTNEIESLVAHLGAYKSEAHKLELRINDLLSSFRLNITQAEGYVESAVTNVSFREYKAPIYQTNATEDDVTPADSTDDCRNINLVCRI